MPLASVQTQPPWECRWLARTIRETPTANRKALSVSVSASAPVRGVGEDEDARCYVERRDHEARDGARPAASLERVNPVDGAAAHEERADDEVEDASEHVGQGHGDDAERDQRDPCRREPRPKLVNHCKRPPGDRRLEIDGRAPRAESLRLPGNALGHSPGWPARSRSTRGAEEASSSVREDAPFHRTWRLSTS